MKELGYTTFFKPQGLKPPMVILAPEDFYQSRKIRKVISYEKLNQIALFVSYELLIDTKHKNVHF